MVERREAARPGRPTTFQLLPRLSNSHDNSPIIPFDLNQPSPAIPRSHPHSHPASASQPATPRRRARLLTRASPSFAARSVRRRVPIDVDRRQASDLLALASLEYDGLPPASSSSPPTALARAGDCHALAARIRYGGGFLVDLAAGSVRVAGAVAALALRA